MKETKDRFSNQSVVYKKFRPVYPEELYTYIYSFCADNNTAWDCGTGNGQVATILASQFKQVEATDISTKQLEQALPASNIHYSVQRAEATIFADNHFDLITVAQALHWFDFDPFFKEVKRVLKPNGIFAAWGYGLLRITPEIDELIDAFYRNVIGTYWDAERKHIDTAFASIQFPFETVESNTSFTITTQWVLPQLEGYLNSWSSVENYKNKHGLNPVDELINQISRIWGDAQLKVTFPIFLKICKK